MILSDGYHIQKNEHTEMALTQVHLLLGYEDSWDCVSICLGSWQCRWTLADGFFPFASNEALAGGEKLGSPWELEACNLLQWTEWPEQTKDRHYFCLRAESFSNTIVIIIIIHHQINSDFWWSFPGFARYKVLRNGQSLLLVAFWDWVACARLSTLVLGRHGGDSNSQPLPL